MQDLMLPQPFLRPYPAPEQVFAEPVKRYARLLHPLISIDISAVDPALAGWVHLVSPIEPYDGCVGQTSEQTWGPYLQLNWIGFRLTQDFRYELLGDFNFFELELAESENDVGSDLTEFYDEEQASFSAGKAAFQRVGQICRIWGADVTTPVPALSDLGGTAPAGNIIWSNVPGTAFTYSDEDLAPRTADGRLYRFIAAVPGWHYRKSGADAILLYYDPVERIVLETFVYT
jgi:hypothetical protein